MQETTFLIEMIYEPKTKKLSKREVNFGPKKVDAFPPKMRAY